MAEGRLEVCAGSIESVKAARDGGAFRVELCSALGEGGVTPSLGFMKEARKIEGILVNVLIRPRGGDFIYTPEEVEAMCEDIRAARACGLDGVVIGALRPDGSIDMEACRKMMAAASGMSVTFHRAFDLCKDMDEAMRDIISLGCDTLLTSGQEQTALAGIQNLRYLKDKYGSSVEIMAGSGVSSSNAREIAESTGCRTLHASARRSVESAMIYRHQGVSMGNPGDDEYSRKETNREEVSEIVSALKSI